MRRPGSATVLALHVVGVQLIGRLAGQHRLVDVFRVYVQVEQGEGGQHDVHNDQPPDHESEQGIYVLRCPVDGDDVGVSHYRLFFRVLRRYWA